MMFLFRSTFITAISALVLMLCAFSMSASAAPQFGRPLFHVLDAATAASDSMSTSMSASYLNLSPTPTGAVDLAPIEVVPSSSATSAGEDPNPDPDPLIVEAVSSSASSTVLAGATQAVGTSSNGASRSFCGGLGVVVGVAVSAVWLVL
ncbi:hypothetical protein K503DRAFT_722500 [Rhizopogon vinicolor AM-OR11-026]|uniref:Uncharacterized protein n=1 Tax=Rhizopogon vinicolor AM-OR11-026 TaxID=1314800 RepID=A0A1B7MT11_9AGAM|nr:hypothetical protein K503DRAFT_722500 [Rhizopogon vinicolor AM-OR11-026]